MRRELNIQHCSLPLNAPFRIARGARTVAEVVRVELSQAGHVGRGECVPYKRYGESIDSVIAQMESMRDALRAGMGRDELQQRLPPGAARNALDAALWDLQSRFDGIPVWTRLACPPNMPLVTALTVSIDTPERMGEDAARLADHGLIKVKVDAENPAERIEAVRRAAPSARLIIDANESWDIAILRELQPVLAQTRVDLVEQPLPADADDALLDFVPDVPVCADEACHTMQDLPRLRGRYQAVNIKLDKTGGLTAALEARDRARAMGFGVMVGCMVGTSLAMAPAVLLAQDADYVDLDGPLLLARDRSPGLSYSGSLVSPPHPALWG